MRVFLTGATGFVGSHVVDRLLEAGHEPVCLVRATSNVERLKKAGVETFVGQLDDVGAMREVVQGVDALIHAAGVVKVRKFGDFQRLNADASGALAALAREVNPQLRRFVYVSSLSAQGPSEGPRPRPEGMAPAPVSHYGRSKLGGETQILEAAGSIPVTIFRPPPVYGPRDHEMLAAFKMAKYGVAPVYGKGSGYLSVVFVKDLATAIVQSLQVKHPAGAVFTIDDGEVHTWKSLTSDIGKAMDKHPRHIRVPGVAFHAAGHVSEAIGRLARRPMIFNSDKVAEMSQQSWVCGHEKLSELLGWTPQWPLERGARHTARWYRSHSWL